MPLATVSAVEFRKRISMILDEHKQTANNTHTHTMFGQSDTSMWALYLLCNNGVREEKKKTEA